MKAIQKIFATTLIVSSMMSVAAAKPLSSTIDFGGGTVAPKGIFEMDLNKLVDGITYDVRCELTNPNQNEIVIGVSQYSMMTYIELDGNQETQPHLSSGDHTLVMHYVSNSNGYGYSLKLINSDQTDSFVVKNCSASAA